MMAVLDPKPQVTDVYVQLSLRASDRAASVLAPNALHCHEATVND